MRSEGYYGMSAEDLNIEYILTSTRSARESLDVRAPVDMAIVDSLPVDTAAPAP